MIKDFLKTGEDKMSIASPTDHRSGGSGQDNLARKDKTSRAEVQS